MTQESQRPSLNLNDLRRVLAIVRRHVPSYLDTESIAADILIESWTNGHPQPSLSFIYNRCVDQLRELTQVYNYTQSVPRPNDINPMDSVDNTEFVNILMTILTPKEKTIIWYRFFREPPLSDTGVGEKLRMPLREVQGIVAQALFKMRQAIE